MNDSPNCLTVQDLLPELAAGVADGDARAWALAHLAGCPDCRRELEEVTAVLDRLLLLAPSHEPAAGFESAVLSSMTREPGRRRPRWLATTLRAAAAVILAVVIGGVIWQHDAGDRRLAAQYRHTLAVAGGRYLTATHMATAGHPDIGQAFAYQGSPSWVFVNIDSAASPGNYLVKLLTTDHKTMDIGWCQVSGRTGSWGRRLDVPVSHIDRIQLSRPGAPTMTATFN
jgi:hypothetical protein